jgi:hypothetical protein
MPFILSFRGRRAGERFFQQFNNTMECATPSLQGVWLASRSVQATLRYSWGNPVLATCSIRLIRQVCDLCQGRCNHEPILNWPPWGNELQRTTFHERRRANADQTAPGSDDPTADMQTPLTERRWTCRRWRPEPLQARLRGPYDQPGAPSCGNCGH